MKFQISFISDNINLNNEMSESNSILLLLNHKQNKRKKEKINKFAYFLFVEEKIDILTICLTI